MKQVKKKNQDWDYPHRKVKYILRVPQKSRNMMFCVEAFGEFQENEFLVN